VIQLMRRRGVVMWQ